MGFWEFNVIISNIKTHAQIGNYRIRFISCLLNAVQKENNGDVTGFCRSEDILQHFVNEHGAIALRMLHEYQIGIFDDAAKHIREVYDYEWTDEEL